MDALCMLIWKERKGDGVNDVWQETGIPRENPHVI